jgi:ADP-dependent NAD(P)H-hydrate dehydratase / NAD(P)H-hydrate epimerase
LFATEAAMRFITAQDIQLTSRRTDSHKGDNGRVLVVAGSDDFVGAAYLAGMAAFRSGVDTVVIAAPERVAWAINCLSPDFISKKFKGSFFSPAAASEIIGMGKKFDVTLIGNGIGKNPKTQKFAAAVCKGIHGFKVIDADAITAVKLQDVENSVFTPHQAEYNTLLKNSGCSDKTVVKAVGSNCILIKGEIDKIVAAGKTTLNKTGNPGMTVGGTGDVLAGLTAGLLAQEKNVFKAASAAAYVNGKAGDNLFRRYGYGFTASNLVEELPVVLKQFW